MFIKRLNKHLCSFFPTCPGSNSLAGSHPHVLVPNPLLFVSFVPEEWPVSSNTIIRHAELLKLAPFVFPFIERVKVGVS